MVSLYYNCQAKPFPLRLKSLNSKTLDLNMRMPSMYRAKELGTFRKLIASRLHRGKVDFSLYFENTGGETFANVNPTVVKKVHDTIGRISPTGDAMQLLQMAVKMPDAISTERDDIDENEWAAIQNEIHTALEKIALYRLEEGNVLEADFTNRIAIISDLLEQVLEHRPGAHHQCARALAQRSG